MQLTDAQPPSWYVMLDGLIISWCREEGCSFIFDDMMLAVARKGNWSRNAPYQEMRFCLDKNSGQFETMQQLKVTDSWKKRLNVIID